MSIKRASPSCQEKDWPERVASTVTQCSATLWRNPTLFSARVSGWAEQVEAGVAVVAEDEDVAAEKHPKTRCRNSPLISYSLSHTSGTPLSFCSTPLQCRNLFMLRPSKNTQARALLFIQQSLFSVNMLELGPKGKFALCAGGIFVCYFYYGILQARINITFLLRIQRLKNANPYPRQLPHQA